MATALSTAAPQNAAGLDARIAGPLDGLRGTIRRYVALEGLLVGGTFLVAWFGLGLLLDYGAFKAFGWDWVLEVPPGVRLFALLVGLALLLALVAGRVVRLTKDLSYPSLALILERRFPAILGDRLITAVELADVGKAAGYGYSEEMIRSTVEEARSRLGDVPVSDAFNWSRLRRMGYVLGALALALAGCAVGAYAATAAQPTAAGFAWRCAHVGGIWAERNVAVMHTPWPRRAHLEFAGSDKDELRVAKDAALTAPVKVRVRAVKWVVADRSAPFGWRPMLWSDVDGLLRTIHSSYGASGSFPPATTVDQAERLGGESLAAEVFGDLRAAAEDPSLGRTLRRLDLPAGVALGYEGSKTKGENTMAPEGDAEYAGDLKDLKESVEYRARADDFSTDLRRVTLVSPPLLSRLTRTEFQPAYLHYAPPDGGTAADLKGLRQRMADQEVSLTGDLSVFSVPHGTEIVLAAATDKPIVEAYLRPKVGSVPGAVGGSWFARVARAARWPLATSVSDAPVPLRVNAAGDGFSTELAAGPPGAAAAPFRVVENLEFDLVFVDTDGIRGTRPILVQRVSDQAPTVDLAVDILRKQGNVYLATPQARVPFVAESVVRDDRGLSRVEYAFEYARVEASAVLGMQAQLVARLVASAPVPAGLPSGVVPAFDATLVRLLSKGDAKRKGAALMSRFEEMRKELRRETMAKIRQDLALPLGAERQEQVTKVKVENYDRDYFDIAKALPELAVGATEIQPRYRLDLNVLAADTNVENEGGPKTGTNPDPIRLLVLSEADLLLEISKEEENLSQRFDELLKKLKEARRKLTDMSGVVSTAAPHEIVNAAVRGLDVAQDQAKARDATQGVLVDYSRILRECEVNQMQKATTTRYREVIVNPLHAILDAETPGTFRAAERALNEVQGPLNEGRKPDFALVLSAQANLEELILKLEAVRAQIGNSLSLDQLRNALQDIITRQKRLVTEELDRIKEELTRRLFKPDLLAIGPVLLNKGETKKIAHAIEWKLYDKDEWPVRLTASDPSLKVPALVRVPADKAEVVYELVAGQKEGEFTVTLTPEPGKVVQVRVTVK